MTITWSCLADFDRDDVYETDLTSAIRKPGSGITIDRGFNPDGSYNISRVGIDIYNYDGTYSYQNMASARAGQLDPGVPISVVATVNGNDYACWTGYVQKFNATGVAAGSVPMCRFECTDLMTYLAESDLVNVTVSDSRDTDGALVAIMDAVGLEAGDRDFADGVQDLPLHYALAQQASQAMMDVVRSEMGGRLFVSADGLLTFEARNTRLGTSVVDTFGDTGGQYPVSAAVVVSNEEYVTAVRTRATVFKTGQADIEIFRFSRGMLSDTPDSLELAAGEVYEREFDTQSAVVSITTPVASIDYLLNLAVDGSSTDVTADLEVTVFDKGAGRFILKLKNTNASTAYLTLFRLRGQPTAFFADRPEAYYSLSVPGRKAGKVVDLDIPFAGDDGKNKDYAVAMCRTYRYSYPRLTVTFLPKDDTEAEALLALELGDRIAYKDTALTTSGTYSDDIWYIESIKMGVPPEWVGNFSMTMELVPSYLFRDLDAIAYDEFDRDDAVGDLGTSTSGDTWADDTGFDIVSGAARPNSTGLQVPSMAVA